MSLHGHAYHSFCVIITARPLGLTTDRGSQGIWGWISALPLLACLFYLFEPKCSHLWNKDTKYVDHKVVTGIKQDHRGEKVR